MSAAEKTNRLSILMQDVKSARAYLKHKHAARRAPGLKRGRAQTLAPDQVCHLLAHLQASSREPLRDHVIVLLSYKAALRAQEIAGLTWKDVYNVSGKIGRSKHNPLSGELEYFFEIPPAIGKGTKGRIVPMHEALRAALEALQRELGPLRTKPWHPIVQSRRFPDPTPLKPNALVVYLRDIYVRAGFQGCSSHSGRRTALTDMAQRANQYGCSLYDVQRFAGHADIETTEVYVEQSPNAGKLVRSL